MFVSRAGRRIAPAFLAIVLAACGGSSSPGAGSAAAGVPGTDPAATINAFVATMEAKAFDKLPNLACSTAKDQAAALDPTKALSSMLPGITAADVLAALNITVSNVKVDAPQISGDTAKVHFTGDVQMSADQAKLKDLVTKALAAQGVTNNDAAVNQALVIAAPAFSQTQKMDNTFTLKQENGTWLICQ